MNFEKHVENVKLLEEAYREVQVPEGMNYQLPPNSSKTLRSEFLDYQARKQLLTSFFIDRMFANPQGTVQGGIIGACFDDTFGPLGVATARGPILSIDLHIQFIRPIPVEQTFYILTRVISVSKTTIYMQADAYNQKGKLLAQSSSNQLIVR
ncbi:MAG: PaaI family thioesterase [Prolixibacteraceae bacterium]|nr:PaaI family thioesterase [Prolixibacteraceae bacterium]